MGHGISVREFARRAGCDEKVVRRKIKSGHLQAFPDGKLDPAHVEMDWRNGISADTPSADIADTADRETPADEADRIVNLEGRASYSKAEAERIKENYLALLRELEYDRESSAVVPIEDVALAVAAEYALIRNKLRGIGSKVAPRAAVLRSPEEVKALVDAEVAAAIGELTLDGHGHSDHQRLQRSLQEKFGKTA